MYWIPPCSKSCAGPIIIPSLSEILKFKFKKENEMKERPNRDTVHGKVCYTIQKVRECKIDDENCCVLRW